jgi:hypothetical protein
MEGDMKKTLLVLLAAFGLVATVIIADRLSAGDRGRASGMPNAVSPSPAAPFHQPAGQIAESRIQWEYRVVMANTGLMSPDELNQLGTDGWEMCGVKQRGQGAAHYFFKREKLSHGAGVAADPYAAPTQPIYPPMNSPRPATNAPVRPTIPHDVEHQHPSAPEAYLPPGSQPVLNGDLQTDPPAFNQELPAAEPPVESVKPKPIGSTGALPSDPKKKPKDKEPSGGRNY